MLKQSNTKKIESYYWLYLKNQSCSDSFCLITSLMVLKHCIIKRPAELYSSCQIKLFCNAEFIVLDFKIIIRTASFFPPPSINLRQDSCFHDALYLLPVHSICWLSIFRNLCEKNTKVHLFSPLQDVQDILSCFHNEHMWQYASYLLSSTSSLNLWRSIFSNLCEKNNHKSACIHI